MQADVNILVYCFVTPFLSFRLEKGQVFDNRPVAVQADQVGVVLLRKACDGEQVFGPRRCVRVEVDIQEPADNFIVQGFPVYDKAFKLRHAGALLVLIDKLDCLIGNVCGRHGEIR